MSIQWRTRSIIILCILTFTLTCVNQCWADSRLAICLSRRGEETIIGYRGKQQAFAAVQEHLKRLVKIERSVLVSFMVQSDVTVQETVELIYKVSALGITNITIEVQTSGHDTSIEDITIRKLRVMPDINHGERSSNRSASPNNSAASDDERAGLVTTPPPTPQPPVIAQPVDDKVKE